MRTQPFPIRSVVATATVAVGLIVSPIVASAHTLHGAPKHAPSWHKLAPRAARASATHAPYQHHAPKGWPWGVTATDLRQWSRVSICEEGGNWSVRGSLYSGGLGITNHNWTYYSRGLGFPANAADATPVQQVAVAKRINKGYAVPDQHGCHSW